MEEEEARELAIAIIDEFEELLAEHGIKVPSDDREDREEEACLSIFTHISYTPPPTIFRSGDGVAASSFPAGLGTDVLERFLGGLSETP